jgi:hypothetical protein
MMKVEQIDRHDHHARGRRFLKKRASRAVRRDKDFGAPLRRVFRGYSL